MGGEEEESQTPCLCFGDPFDHHGSRGKKPQNKSQQLHITEIQQGQSLIRTAQDGQLPTATSEGHHNLHLDFY